MNNTHVYSLRRTPVGYNGPTSMYEGTRIISIATEPHAEEVRKKENAQRDRKSASRNPVLSRGPARGDGRERRDKFDHAQRRAPQPEPRTGGNRPAPSESRIPAADSRGRNAHISSSRPEPTNTHDRHRPAQPAPAQKQRRDAGNRRVLSRSQAGTGDFTAGVSVTSDSRHHISSPDGRRAGQNRADREREQRRSPQMSDRERRTRDAASVQRQQSASSGVRGDIPRDRRAYPPRDERVPRDVARDGRISNASLPAQEARPGYRTQPAQGTQSVRGNQTAYDTQQRRGMQSERSARGGYNNTQAGYTQKTDMRGERTAPVRGNAERTVRGGTEYGRTAGYTQSGVRAYSDEYNKNPVYCYGNRTSADAENGRSGIPGGRGRQNVSEKAKPNQKPNTRQNPKQKKLTPEEKSRMRAAENARRKAERQIELERREKKKLQGKAIRGKRRVQRRAAVKEFRTALLRALVRSVPFMILFFITFAISAGLFAVSVFAALNINLSGLPDTVKYQIGEDDAEDKMVSDLPTERFVRDGIVYMSMDDFAERFEYTVAGNSKELKYISRTSDDIVEVTLGTSAVVVNDVPLRLTAPVVRDGEEILIPLDFFSTYATGFTVSYDEEAHKVTMIREIIDYNVTVADGKTPIYAGAGFKPSLLAPIPNIAEGSLPSDILAATDPNPPAPETDEFGNPVTGDDGTGASAE